LLKSKHLLSAVWLGQSHASLLIWQQYDEVLVLPLLPPPLPPLLFPPPPLPLPVPRPPEPVPVALPLHPATAASASAIQSLFVKLVIEVLHSASMSGALLRPPMPPSSLPAGWRSCSGRAVLVRLVLEVLRRISLDAGTSNEYSIGI
jgi:hypothetical protein